MRKEYLAHSGRNGYQPESYREHLVRMLELIRHFVEELKPYCRMDARQLENILFMAVLYHDLGKLDERNQEVLQSIEKYVKKLPVNHVDAGAAFLKQKGLEAMYSLLLVYSHHRGLPDSIEEEIRTEEACYRDASKEVRDYVDSKLEELLRIHDQLFPDVIPHICEEWEGDPAVFFRILMSCMADADHLDTARVYGNFWDLKKAPRLNPKRRLEQLDKYVKSLSEGQHSKRSELRTQMYQECRACVQDAGIFSNDGPVGSGKTTAIMACQLHQAILKNARHIFVILPYTNLIEQSVEIYRKALVLPGENPEEVAAELHHKADFENEDARYLTSLWRAPIIVTTAAAFFETLASNRPAVLRRLHELPGSIIYIDEAHAALPLKLLPLAFRWMEILEKEWGCCWILASGSLVRFWQIPKLMGEEKREVPDMIDGALRGALQEFEKKRVYFDWKPCPQSREELIDWVMKEPGPRLVILNTVQSAAVIAEDFRKKYGRTSVEHLSTALMPKNRAETMETVKRRLQDQKDTDWVLVATSCVEAGVDFSFRTGFREISSVLSLLQVAGRVSRNGEYQDCKVWSFLLKDDRMLTRNPEFKTSAAVLEEYLREGMEITPTIGTKAMEDELCRGKTMRKEIQSILEAEENLNFKTVKEKFCVIDSDTVTVIVDAAAAERIRERTADWRDIQKYSVTIGRSKRNEWNMKPITEEIYQWTLPYDPFLGYMRGVLKQEGKWNL